MTDIQDEHPAQPRQAEAGDAGDAGDLLKIRSLADPDIDPVRELWGGYVSEGFADNFADGDAVPDSDLDQYLSLDRWGPGISTPVLPGALRPHMPKEPSFAVAEQVAAMVGHPSCRCLVAELAGTIVGFVTYSIRPLATMDEHVASIDELFVDPVARCAGIGTALVESAVGDLHREAIGVIHAMVPRNPRYARARRLFAALGWDQDLIAFGLYG